MTQPVDHYLVLECRPDAEHPFDQRSLYNPLTLKAASLLDMVQSLIPTTGKKEASLLRVRVEVEVLQQSDLPCWSGIGRIDASGTAALVNPADAQAQPLCPDTPAVTP